MDFDFDFEELRKVLKNVDLDLLFAELRANKRVCALANELNITKNEFCDVLPILLTIIEEDNSKAELDHLTTIIRDAQGILRPVTEFSEHGLRNAYMQNVRLTYVYPFDYEESKVLTASSERKELFEKFSTFYNDFLNGRPVKGLYIYGDNHVGKSLALKKFAKKLADNNKTVAVLPVPSIFSNIRNKFGSGASKQDSAKNESAKQEIIAELKEVDVLFLDDLGAETIQAWFRDDILYDVLSTRAANQKPIFIGSNFSPSKLIDIEAKTSYDKGIETEKAKKLVAHLMQHTQAIFLKGKKWI